MLTKSTPSSWRWPGEVLGVRSIVGKLKKNQVELFVGRKVKSKQIACLYLPVGLVLW